MSKGTSAVVDVESLLADLPAEARRSVRARQAIHAAGQLVRRMREKAGLKQWDLAEAIGTTQSAISDLERGSGSQGPTIGLLNRIADACGEVLVLACESDYKAADATPEQEAPTLASN